uniref:Uncharacterized protein n=1 Tax=Sphaerodactylus townsendi TaxID=933632 RepID=A0ACB8FBV8_9SAUR
MLMTLPFWQPREMRERGAMLASVSLLTRIFLHMMRGYRVSKKKAQLVQQKERPFKLRRSTSMMISEPGDWVVTKVPRSPGIGPRAPSVRLDSVKDLQFLFKLSASCSSCSWKVTETHRLEAGLQAEQLHSPL